jgi:hypothetical protein
MTTSPIETMITNELSECKYESAVDAAYKTVFASAQAAFPSASVDQVFYYWEKAAKAKKQSIRRNIIG